MRSTRIWIASLLVLLLAACGSDSSGEKGATKETGTLNVFAAASLTGAFTEIGKAFEAAKPGATVTFNFGASSTLVTQISQGAPADVFASADRPTMQRLVDASRAATTPLDFATNKLQIMVGHGNPKGITKVADLARGDVVVVACDPAVPIGRYTQEVFGKAGVTVKVRSLEPDVKGIVGKVTAGEADAGVVYVSDVKAAGNRAEGIVIDDSLNVTARYPIAVVRDTPRPKLAQSFVDFVRSTKARNVLNGYGFTEPPS